MLANQREFTRVMVALHAELRVGGDVVITGMLENISFNGLQVHCETSLPVRTPCRVCLHLHSGEGGPTIEAQGIVTRQAPQGLAVQFTELIGRESAQHLRNLVLYNSGIHTDRIEGELDSHLGLRSMS